MFNDASAQGDSLLHLMLNNAPNANNLLPEIPRLFIIAIIHPFNMLVGSSRPVGLASAMIMIKYPCCGFVCFAVNL
jgi:hypothetical protein